MSSQASTTTASPTTNATGAPACTCDIPSIDLRPYFEDKGVVIGHPATKDQLDVSRRINDACKEHGFVHVTNFGFTGTMARRMFDASKDLFDNPLKVNQYVPWSPSTNIGFSPYQNETLNTNRKPDLKEAFNLRFPPRWTKDMHKFESLPKSFQSMVNNIYHDDEHEKDGSDGNSLFSVFQLIATRYAMACAVALGLSPTAFSKTLTNYNLCTVRFLHYPPTYMEHNDNSGDDDGTTSSSVAIRAGEHTDFVSGTHSSRYRHR
jgi:isopenicillin N synthase-like dioxygenase